MFRIFSKVLASLPYFIVRVCFFNLINIYSTKLTNLIKICGFRAAKSTADNVFRKITENISEFNIDVCSFHQLYLFIYLFKEK